MTNREFLWTESYRPHTIADTILPIDLKSTFQKFVDIGAIPTLLLTGKPGTGKTTVARAMLDQMGADYIMINGSLEGRQIDTLRNQIQQYASSMSLVSSGRKYIILDEADHLNPVSFQPALRNFMEEYSENVGFILTGNYKSKIIDPLISRCSVVDFTIPPQEKPKLAAQFMKRTEFILGAEGITYEKKVVAELIMKFFPDWRRILNELQRYSVSGKIDVGILSNFHESSLSDLINNLKGKKFTEVRKWVAEHSDFDTNDVFRMFYDRASEIFMPVSIPPLVLILARYQYQDAFVVDKQINLAAFFVEVMVDLQFK